MNNPKVRMYLLMLVIGTGILMYLPLIRSLQTGSFLLSAAYFVLLPIAGLALTAVLYVLLYALIAALCGGRVQLIGLYPFQLSRKENGGWRVQVLPAAEAGLGMTLAAVPWEEETSGLQQRAQLILHYAVLALAVLFGVLTAQCCLFSDL